MEPLTHFLTGACLSRAGLNRKTGLATLTLVLASEMPDVDVVSAFGGSVNYFQHHRGITHTLLGAPFVAAGTIALVYGIYRLLLARGRKPKLPPSWLRLYLYAVFAVLIHIFLDFTNSYGVRPFAPFSWKWYSWDLLFILDPILLGILLLAVFAPALFGLISEEIGERKSPRGRGAAIFALVFLAAVIYFRDFEHRRAVNLLEQRTYGDEEPIRVSAYGTVLNPFEWQGVVETQTSLRLMPVNPRAGEIDDESARIWPKPEETAATHAAKESRVGRVYLDWAQYPRVEADRLPDENWDVEFTDLRFYRLRDDHASQPLTGYAILNPKLKVIEMRIGGPKPDTSK